jgi:DNA-binding protein HU-beta
MTKAELVGDVAAKTGLSKKDAEAALNEIIAGLKKAIKKDGRFVVPDFGTFTVKKRKARIGRNPATGATIKIGASKTVGFKPAPGFKKSL